MSTVGITLNELLADNEAATAKWHAWFAANPAALNAPCDIYDSKTVRGLIQHIFDRELRHASRLAGSDTAMREPAPTDSVEEIFAAHAEAVQHLRGFLAQAPDAALHQIIAIPTVSAGTLQASRRKLFVHVMLHSIRHWAQLSTHLRTQGYKTPWPKDFLMSEAMQ